MQQRGKLSDVALSVWSKSSPDAVQWYYDEVSIDYVISANFTVLRISHSNGQMCNALAQHFPEQHLPIHCKEEIINEASEAVTTEESPTEDHLECEEAKSDRQSDVEAREIRCHDVVDELANEISASPRAAPRAPKAAAKKGATTVKKKADDDASSEAASSSRQKKGRNPDAASVSDNAGGRRQTIDGWQAAACGKLKRQSTTGLLPSEIIFDQENRRKPGSRARERRQCSHQQK
eukprot:GEMP01040389.1.p1 GENE.GEMP01040389.1~~GEMP01040389.1.p1  ORF type:complete len:235 (+),score=61.47 GEMP01040389.1:92-796(+)